jgi:hypothetical protein
MAVTIKVCSIVVPILKLVGVLAILSAVPSVEGGIADEWTGKSQGGLLTTSALSSWMTWMEADPTIEGAFALDSMITKDAHDGAVWYASNCLSLCHLGVDNFCAATQTCIMSGVFSGQSASSCNSISCLSSKLCSLNIETMETCKSTAKTWSHAYTKISTNRATLGTTLTTKALVFAHGLLGCFRSSLGSSSTLASFMGDLDTYQASVNLTDSTSGLSEVIEKLKEQTLVFEWLSAFIRSRCDGTTSRALTDTSKMGTIVCQAYKDSTAGMTNDANANEKFCFFPASGSAVTGCTSTTSTFSDLSSSFAAMLDNGHGCVTGGKCCKAIGGSFSTLAPTTAPPTKPRSAAAKNQSKTTEDIDLELLDLAEHPTLSELELQWGGGAAC